MVGVMASVDDVSALMDKVHDGIERFKRGGVRKIWVYRALDDGREVMILQEIEDELSARQWIDHPDAAAEWMSNAGFGAYPTQFVGRFAHLMSIGERGLTAMFVCLCTGVTSHVVNEVVANGAKTSKQIAEACGAGGDCGRCRRTLRAMIEAHYAVNGCAPETVQPLVQQLPDPFDAEPGQIEIAGEQSLVTQPGFQPRDRDAERDRREHFVVAQVAHRAARHLLVPIDGFLPARRAVQPAARPRYSEHAQSTKSSHAKSASWSPM